MEALRGACSSEFGKHKNAELEGYINRFFHPRLALPPPDHKTLVKSMPDAINNEDIDSFGIFLKRFDVSPRCFYSAMEHFQIIRSLHNDIAGWERPSMMFAALFHTVFSTEENQLIIDGHPIWKPFREGEKSILERFGIFETNPTSDTLLAATLLHAYFLLPEDITLFKKYGSQALNDNVDIKLIQKAAGWEIPEGYFIDLLKTIRYLTKHNQELLRRSGRKYLKDLQALRISFSRW